ncbi:siderophore-interacting protein [Micromonospora sp. WMMD1082]|uniref:siderophore-interacting protein n=1 Tax=Micromonospora sp. WMMD1082 TaxID=3016104 RepID=UPI002415AA06|nr:siderophore-interacting protein [Micromonospora sp. WMMD1082]MDG4795650.1 siderophore-interacting protein [Micromonospora sp. WMMD1082]
MTADTATSPARVRRPMPARVLATRKLTPRLVRITLTGAELDTFGYDGPDHLVRVFLPPEPGAELRLPDGADSWWPAVQAMPAEVRPIVRNYTVRRLDEARREMDIDFVLHGDTGPGSSWAASAAVGDQIGVLSDGAEYAPPPDTVWQLLIGDETALPAIAATVEALPSRIPAVVLLEVGDATDEMPIALPDGARLTWLHRGAEAAGRSDIALRTLRGSELPVGTPYAFVAGESSMVTSVRRHLVQDRGMAKERVYFCGYWRAAPAPSITS